jgi:hypothetical protein
MSAGTLILTNWKTGRDDDEYETEPQMAAYVRWVKRADDTSPVYNIFSIKKIYKSSKIL